LKVEPQGLVDLPLIFLGDVAEVRVGKRLIGWLSK